MLNPAAGPAEAPALEQSGRFDWLSDQSIPVTELV